MRSSSAVHGAWAEILEPRISLQIRLSQSMRIPDFLLFILIGLNGGLPALGGTTTAGELAAIPLTVLGFMRPPERGWRQNLGVTALVCAIFLWSLTSAISNDLYSYTRLGHIALYCLILLFLAEGRLDVLAAARGAAVGLLIGIPYGILRMGADGYAGRLAGILGDPNAAGYYLLTLGLVYIGLENSKRRSIAIGLILAVGIVLTWSRTTLLATFLIVVWWLLPQRANIALRLLAMGIIYRIASNVSESLKQWGVFADREGSDALRARLLPAEQHLVSEKAWIGHGPGTVSVELEGQFRYFHSSYLLLRAEGGWILFGVMIALVVVAAWALLRSREERPNVALEGALIAPLICGLNIGNVFLDFPTAVAIGVGLWWANAPASTPTSQDPGSAVNSLGASQRRWNV